MLEGSEVSVRCLTQLVVHAPVRVEHVIIEDGHESTFEGSMGKVKADYNSDFDLYATTPDAEFYVERGETTENNMETTP